MPSLKDLKHRITSIKSTQKITKAMKMVAASKLKRARDNATAAAPYAETMISLIHNLRLSGANSIDNGVSLLTGNGENKIHLLVIFTSDKGLCGAFNMNIVKLAKRKIEALIQEGKTVKIIIVGRKGFDLLRSKYDNLIIEHLSIDGKIDILEHAQCIARNIISMFKNRQFDVCHLIFSIFKTALSQEPVTQQMIPLNLEKEEAAIIHSYEYEPNEQAILKILLPLNIETQIYRAMLESLASEHASRMTAMDNASRNSSEMIKDLTMLYNRSRQSQITKELVEIIAGSESMQG